jgi:uncharacterized membrane protein
MSRETGSTDRLLPAGWYKAALIIAGIAAYQILIYALIVDQPDGGLGEGLMAAPLALVFACMLIRTPGGRMALAVLVAMGIAGWLFWKASGASPSALYPVPYVTVYLVLLWFFGRTLRAGRQPLITRLAMHVHGELPAELAAYTRNVTVAWCIFFLAMVATSILLFVFEPFPVWSAFNNLLNLPLVVAMYLCEYAWRLHRYPNFSHASIATVVRAVRNFDFNRPATGR